MSCSIKQYTTFVDKAATQNVFLEFCVSKDHLDELLYDNLGEKWWHETTVACCLNYPTFEQATVERGFSVNKVTMMDNLSERTLIAKWVIKDNVMSIGGRISDIALTPGLLAAAASGRHQYQLYLDEQKKLTAEQRGNKRKMTCDELDT